MRRLILVGLFSVLPSLAMAYDFNSTFSLGITNSPGVNQEFEPGSVFLFPDQVAQLNSIHLGARVKERTMAYAQCFITPAADRLLSVAYSEKFFLKFYSTPGMGQPLTFLAESTVDIRTETYASMVVNTAGIHESAADADIKRSASVEVPTPVISALRGTGAALVIKVMRRGLSEQINQEGQGGYECYVSNSSAAQGAVTLRVNYGAN